MINKEGCKKISVLLKEISVKTQCLFNGGVLSVETCEQLVKDINYNIEYIKRILKGKEEIMDKIKTIIEGVFLDSIKHVGDSEHTYYGTPAEMIDKLTIKINKQIKDEE